MKDQISSSQKLVLELIRAAGEWNNFRGDRIASDLEQNSHLWQAVYFTTMAGKFFPELSSYGIDNQVSLLPLRQLAEGYLSHDTLFVLPATDAHSNLEQLVSSWGADDISWWSLEFVSKAMMVNRRRPGRMFPDAERSVLYLWWD